ncbi:MAG: alkaline phosphatase PafA [Bacteroidota bacterium]|jgi:predicted AlkP superfamily pyrophosphatase or phosphodiesterase
MTAISQVIRQTSHLIPIFAENRVMRLPLSIILTLSFTTSFAQEFKAEQERPKLVVGIIIDQMRYDYLTRYWDKFGDGGFKKLVNGGFNCTNTHYNYVPTYTGPGHASIYTGTTPATHGIIGNNWYERSEGKGVYVTSDSTAKGIGSDGLAGKQSPSRLLTTTISDELRLWSNLRSKVIGIALKDRGAILPAGASANAAYWYDGISGKWITSNWYMNEMPTWANRFNEQKLPDEYLSKPWNTLLPIEQYTESTPDDTPYEDLFPGETKPVFPHDLKVGGAKPYDLLKYSPLGNTFTMKFALEALKGEQLGLDGFTDLLAVSFSTPDYVGHQFGTHAIETQDIYLRLDRDLATMITLVEKEVGKENVLFFLTADHAAIPNVGFMQSHQLNAGIFNAVAASDSLSKHLVSKYGAGNWILDFENDQVYLNHQLIADSKLDLESVSIESARFLSGIKGVSWSLTARELYSNEYTWGIKSLVQKGYYPKRSGDVVIILEPGLVEYKTKGTTHGAGYTYDTHVPLLFYGWRIKPGILQTETCITDIAPTVSRILGIQPPNGTTGKVIAPLLENISKNK